MGNFPRQSTPSAVAPVQVTCNIRADPISPTAAFPHGWAQQSIPYGKFEGYTQSQSDGTALVVSFSYTPGSTSHFPMASTTTYNQYSYLAAIMSFSSDSNDLGSASNNFAYFGKSGNVPEGPPAPGTPNSFGDALNMHQLAVETALWSYDPTTWAHGDVGQHQRRFHPGEYILE
ncbi:hypothetical protein FB45DRAFT_1038285 [Roridomyces roridus]|uniref:Uncharacterized protein n=1 Tax=Roridomyces roridus TaxID=1738132 RepID=A0AAD7F910_9AGAR|nr:hypothetical protein FB45DRAFT_1038285 [Roridomyces roridus]